MNIETNAIKLAQLMKDSGDDDAGSFAHYFVVSGKQWNDIVDRAYELLPTMKVNPRERAAWTKADKEILAEQRNG